MTATINFILLTLLGRVQEIVPGLSLLKPVMFGMVLGLAVLLVCFRYEEIGRKWRRPTLFWLLASIGFAFSVPFSLYLGQSLTFLAMTYLCTAVLFLLVSQCVRRFATLESLAKGLVAMTLILGVAIVVNPRELSTTSGPRLSLSDSYDSNDLALIYAMGLPFLLYWFWRGGVIGKGVCVLAAMLAVYGIYRTGSRGGLVALATVAVYVVLRVREAGPILRAALAIAIAFGAVVMTRTETFQQLILALQGKDYNTTAEDGRLQIWKRGIGYALSHPLVGVGVKCFEVAEGDKELSGRVGAVSGIRWAEAHNSYIQIAAENGLVTFAFWLAMIASTFRELSRQRAILLPWGGDRAIRRMLVFQSVLRASLWAYAVGGLFLSLGYLPYLYLLVGMTVALAEITDRVAFDVSVQEAEMREVDVEAEAKARELPLTA